MTGEYTPRFIAPGLLPALLDCFRRTAVGHTDWRPTRYGRMLRACEVFLAANPGAGTPTGVYKDLSAALEPTVVDDPDAEGLD